MSVPLDRVRAFAAGLRRGHLLRRAAKRKAVFCTIATESFLPWTLVLFDALARHHPGAARALLYVRSADEAHRLPVIEGVHVVGVEDLIDAHGESELRRRYNIAELCFASKPRLLRHCVERLAERAYYLDSDLDVVAPLDEAAIALEGADIVLTPHLDVPIPRDGKLPSELTISRSGACNAGFVAVARSSQARAFLEWWDERVAHWGFVAPEFGFQGDQKWLDLAPSLFPGVALLRDPGSNVGGWNVHGRRVERHDGRLVANGSLLAFFHFSGFDPDRPEVLSKYQNRVHLPHHPVLAEIAREYASRIVAARPRAAALTWTARPAPPREETSAATHSPEPMEDSDYRARLGVDLAGGSYEAGEEIVTRVTVTNASNRKWAAGRAPDGSGGIAVSWHVRERDGTMLKWENHRMYLPCDLAPGESVEMRFGINAMRMPGRYLLEFDLVHEGHTWFTGKGGDSVTVPLFVGQFDDGT